MKATFSEAESFQADISSWNTASVTDMSDCFYRAHSFAGNVGSWNVQNVIDFEQTFGETYLTDAADLSSWRTTSARNFNVRQSLQRCSSENSPLLFWSTLTPILFLIQQAMFYLSTYDGQLTNFVTNLVTDMSYMYVFVLFSS